MKGIETCVPHFNIAFSESGFFIWLKNRIVLNIVQTNKSINLIIRNS